MTIKPADSAIKIERYCAATNCREPITLVIKYFGKVWGWYCDKHGDEKLQELQKPDKE